MLVRAVALAHRWYGGRGYGACFWHWREKATVLCPKLWQLLNMALQVQLALGQLRSVLEITAQQQQQSGMESTERAAAAAALSTAQSTAATLQQQQQTTLSTALRAVSDPASLLLVSCVV